MFVRLENIPRDYAWGSTTAIAELLGRKPSGFPEAELWLGTHAGSPIRIVDPAVVGGYQTLAQWVAAEPEFTLGATVEQAGEPAALGFLLKILAAEHPLSLQTHPSVEQARDGFAREDAAGIPLSSPSRNYKDRNHKPELIVALSPTFEALCGFRPAHEVIELLGGFAKLGHASGVPVSAIEDFAAVASAMGTGGDERFIAWALEWLLTRADGVRELVDECVLLAAVVGAHHTAIEAELATISELAPEYPGDPGIVLALLLNRVRLNRGEALYLPAGNMHAYLRGLGVELMASSDNVLRGGLTPKHVDVAELLTITQCQPLPIPRLPGATMDPGVEIFAPDISDFSLVHASLEKSVNGGHASVNFGGPAIVICAAGEIVLTGEQSSLVLSRGEFCFASPGEGTVALDGLGEIFVARQGLSPANDE